MPHKMCVSVVALLVSVVIPIILGRFMILIQGTRPSNSLVLVQFYLLAHTEWPL